MLNTGINFTVAIIALLTQTNAYAAVAQQPSYGVFTLIVASAGSLIAAGTAITLCWKGRSNWEPSEEDIPRSAQKTTGLLIAIAIAIIWYKFSQQGSFTPNDLISMTMCFGGVTVMALILYGILVGVFVYEKTFVVSGKETALRKIIGGLWITEEAKEALKSGDPRPSTVKDLYIGAAFDEDRVWPPIARALAKAMFQIAYIALVTGGTCALAVVSMLIASAVQ